MKKKERAKLRYDLSVKYTQDFKDIVQKKNLKWFIISDLHCLMLN